MVAPIAGGAIASSPIASDGSAASETASQRFVRILLGAYSSEPLVVLLEITHAALPTPIRVTNDGADVTSRGNLYQSFPFDIDLPGDGEGDPIARLRIANVDRSIGDAIDLITTPATISMTLVLVDSPDVLQREWAFYELRRVTRNALEITGEIPIRQYSTEPFPNIRVRQSNFQNVYR